MSDVDRTDRRELYRRIITFAAVGVANGVTFAVMFLLVRRTGASPLVANAIALAISLAVSFTLNRRFTFQRRGRTDWGGEAVRFLITYLLTGAISTAALLALSAWASPTEAVEAVVAFLANASLMVVRFASLQSWVFRDDAPDATTDNAPDPRLLNP